ncbi:MAG: hypothetical protein HY754_10565 [Nitrospirae bacterium]|nr:hypothetical protein [Nitrospirota bacterium]
MLRWKIEFVVLVCILTLSVIANAQDLQNVTDNADKLYFSAKSEEKIAGAHSDLGVSFSSVLEKDGYGYVMVDIRLKDKKQLIAKINYKDETFDIKFISLENGKLVRLTKEDLHTFQILNYNLLLHFQTFSMSKVVDALLSTLNLLGDYPPNEFIDISSIDTQSTTWTSLCKEIGESYTATFTLSDSSLCGKYENCSFDESTMTCTCTETIGPCESGYCYGRCGDKCSSIGDNLLGNYAGIQRFTQECFNHDLCARAEGGRGLGENCRDEFKLAKGGYFHATNCNEITGDWIIEMTGTSCFEGKCEDTYSTQKVFHFSSEDYKTYARFSGVSDSSSIDNRVSEYEGTIGYLSTLFPGWVSGSWQIPTYMTECSNQPDGYASGTFTGQNKCGEMTMNLEGVWGWYNIDKCTHAGDGSFSGTSTATKNWDSNSKGYVDNRPFNNINNLKTGAVPSGY